MKYAIKVSGEPIAKARPRFTKMQDGKPFVYTPLETRKYENLIKLIYMDYHGATIDELQGELKLTVMAYFKMPKSASKKKKQQMELGEIRPIKKPDMDNIIKIVSDALNGIAYEDDKQITNVVAEKYYSYEPRVEITVEKIRK